MKLTKDQITEKREELCKVLVAMNKQKAKAEVGRRPPTPSPISVDRPGNVGRPRGRGSVDRLAQVGRPSAAGRSSERDSSVDRTVWVGRPSQNHFRRGPSSVRMSRTGAAPGTYRLEVRSRAGEGLNRTLVRASIAEFVVKAA